MYLKASYLECKIYSCELLCTLKQEIVYSSLRSKFNKCLRSFCWPKGNEPLLEGRNGEENAIVVNGVADAVAVDLKRSEAGEGAQVLAADLRRRNTHPTKN